MNSICAHVDDALEKVREPVCVHGFIAQIPGVAQMLFPVAAAPFRIWSSTSSTAIQGTSLGIPAKTAIHIAVPPSTHVELDVFHPASRIRARAISANGDVVAEAVSMDGQKVTQKLQLTGSEIIRVDVDGGNGEEFLSSICTDERISVERWKGRWAYDTGTFNLPLQEPVGTWAVIVISQSMDVTPTGGDPIAAARRLGGVVNSENVQEQGECTCTPLFDHVRSAMTAAQELPYAKDRNPAAKAIWAAVCGADGGYSKGQFRPDPNVFLRVRPSLPKAPVHPENRNP